MDKTIVCLDMDCYFVSVERLVNANLKGKPVVIGGPAKSRGVVSACSYETRDYGVRSGMSLTEAYHRCPKAVFMTSTPGVYSEYSRKIKMYLEKWVPIVSQASVDEFYLDITGCERLYGNLYNFAWNLKLGLEKELGLPASMGMGRHKHIAKVACNMAKQQGFIYVQPHEEKHFLSGLPINSIQGVGKETEKSLIARGFTRVEHLAQLTHEQALSMMGKWGVSLWLKAQGEGSQSLSGGDAQKSISHDTTLPKDTSDSRVLRKIVARLSEKIGYDLRKEGWKARKITLKLRYSDFKTHTKQITIAPTHHDDTIFNVAWSSFELLNTRRLQIRMVGVSVGELEHEYTLSLFEDAQKKDDLYAAIDKIKNKFGKSFICAGRSFDALNQKKRNKNRNVCTIPETHSAAFNAEITESSDQNKAQFATKRMRGGRFSEGQGIMPSENRNVYTIPETRSAAFNAEITESSDQNKAQFATK
ncbi:MAG: DNA polymerase IV, partial [bacterium]|nr:DNA polymerase IV [bacterium]